MRCVATSDLNQPLMHPIGYSDHGEAIKAVGLHVETGSSVAVILELAKTTLSDASPPAEGLLLHTVVCGHDTRRRLDCRYDT